MEVEPATIAQVRRMRDGRMLHVDDDVSGVARDLRAISPALRLMFSETSKVFVVYQRIDLPDGSSSEKLVTTAQECDQRLVRRVQRISSQGYDYAGELERQDDQADRDRDHAFSERAGPLHERTAHALRKDIGVKNRIFVPPGAMR